MKKATFMYCLMLPVSIPLFAVDPNLLEEMETYLGKPVLASAVKASGEGNAYIISESKIDESTSLIVRCMVTDDVVKIITRLYRCSDIDVASKWKDDLVALLSSKIPKPLWVDRNAVGAMHGDYYVQLEWQEEADGTWYVVLAAAIN